jgi:hypothetical protein
MNWLLCAIGAALLSGGVLAVHHHGVVKGEAARDSYWQPLFLQAEKAAAEANAKTAAIETAQAVATTQAEAHHAEVIHDISTRYVAANGRIRTLSLRLQANSTCGREVRSVPESPHELDGPSPSEERAFRTGDAIADIGRRCELDAAALSGLQDWIRQQQQVNP